MSDSLMLRLDGQTLWLGGDSRRLDDDDRQRLDGLALRAAAWSRARGDAWLKDIGGDLYDWLGGWGVRLRTPQLTLDVVAEDVIIREVPWELLHDGGGFLVERGFEVVRRLEPASTLPPSRPAHGLTIVFMAAAPDSPGPGLRRLRYEAEEAAILGAVRDKPLLLSVEETGTARGLGDRLSDLGDEAPSPVVHITCHGTATPTPALLLEDDRGGVALTTAQGLLDHDSAGYLLRDASLVVVSACETAGGDVASFVVSLVREGVQAALGWSASVSDAQATVFVAKFYEKLHTGWPLSRALNAARLDLKGKAAGQNTDWHLARLVAGPRAGGGVAKPGGRLPPLGTGSRAFGEERKLQIATRLDFVGRRRELQEALRVLAANERAGVLLTGLGHQGKSSLAGRIADRHKGVVAVCWGAEELKAPSILQRVQHALGVAGTREAEEHRAAMVRDDGALQEKLYRLLGGAERPILLVLDDVEQVLVREATPVRVQDALLRTMRGVIEAFRQLAMEGRPHRLVLTSRFMFVLPGVDGKDLVAAGLHTIHLSGLPVIERELLPTARQAADLPAKERAICLDASAGNPGLVELLLRLARDLAATDELENLPEMVEDQPRDVGDPDELDLWMADVVGVLVSRLTDTQKALLHLSGVLPGPVPREAVLAGLGPAAGATERDAARLEALGLWEQHRDEEIGATAVAPAPLALRFVEELDRTTARDLARSLLEALPDLGLSPLAREPIKASTRVRLGLVAERGEGLAGLSERVLGEFLDVYETQEARVLGRAVIAQLRADNVPIPDQIRVLVARAVEDDSPDEALALLSGLSDPSLGLLRQGELRRRRGDVLGAEQCFRDLAKVQRGNPQEHALALASVAGILGDRGEVDEALSLHHEAFSALKACGDFRSAAITAGEIAESIGRRGDVEEALRIHLEEELPIYKRLGDVRSRAGVNRNIAGIGISQDSCRLACYALFGGGWFAARSGLRQTTSIGSQFRIGPLHRSGWRARAAS